jgi:hypothetical protein
MRKILTLALSVAALNVIAAAGVGRASAQQIDMVALGSLTCGQLLEEEDAELLRQAVYGWATGYVTGMSVGLAQSEGKKFAVDTLTMDHTVSFVLDRCRENPEMRAGEAVAELLRTLDVVKADAE